MNAHYLVKLERLAAHRCEEVAEFIAERANAHAPVRQAKYVRPDDTDGVTLKGSYYTEKDPLGDGWLVRSRAPYWHFVEFGTSKHGDAQPHVRTAVREAKARFG